MPTTSPSPAPARQGASADHHHDTPAIAYRVELADLHAHLYRVTLTVQAPQAQQRVSLPVWIPGSYMVREFSKHLQQLEAHQGRKAVDCRQRDKNSWDLTAEPGKPLVLRYLVHAHDSSVRTAFLCRDKPAMKEALRAADVPCAQSLGTSSAQEVREFARQVGFPLILKPRDSAGAGWRLCRMI